MDHDTRKSGFTMIELLVTIGIVAILSSVSFISLGTYRKKQNIERTLDEVVAAVQSTQKRSVTQEDGYAWGMRFENNTTSHTYEIFKGSTYASSTSMSKLGLSRALQFMNPYASSTFDALFAPITGALSSKKVISVGTGRNDSYVGDLILNTLGRATKRTEDGIVGYWHFDEGTGGTSADASGNGKTVTLQNGATWASESSCKAGKCASFDGVNDYASFSTITLPGEFTFEAWVYFDTLLAAWHGIISGSGGNRVLMRQSSHLYMEIAGSTNIGTASLGEFQNGKWYHYAITRDANNAIKVYRDGQQKHSTSRAGTATFNILGTQGSYYLHGFMDEARLYSRALTADEILNHYNDLK